MKSRRKTPRRGRHLGPHEAAPLVALVPEAATLHDTLSSMGWALHDTVRPYLRADGQVTVRFVWRRRADGFSASVTSAHTLRVEGAGS